MRNRIVPGLLAICLAGNAAPQTPRFATQLACAAYPTGFLPFTSVNYISAPNGAGDRLLVGILPLENYSALANIVPLPGATNQQFCGLVSLASGYAVTAYVPTSAERNGNFSAFAGLFLDPLNNNQPFPNGILPLSRIGGTFAWRIAGATGTALSITSGPNYGTFSVGDLQAALVASGGTPPYTWTVTSGALPAGAFIRTDDPSFLAAGAAAGIVGVGTAPGLANFTLKVTDSATPANTATQSASLLVTALTISDPPQLADGFTGVAYSRTLTAGGATGAVTWSLQNGTSLPPGLTLTNGTISGSPTTVGNYSFGIVASDSTGSVARNFNLNIPGPGIAGSSALGNVTFGAPISPITLAGQGGEPPYTFSGGFVPGLTMSPAGVITGTPTAGNGPIRFPVVVYDSSGASFQRTFALNVIGAPGSNTLPQLNYPNPADDATLGAARTYAFTVNGGKQPYTWSVSGLPPGMYLRTTNLSPNSSLTDIDAEIAGAPLTAGTVNAIVSVTDGSSPAITMAQPFSFKVVAMDIDFTPATGTRGVPYWATIRPIGGAAPFTFAIAPGSLPGGLALNTATGVISGTPVENGSFSLRVTITSSPASGRLQISRTVTLSINPPTTPLISFIWGSALPDTIVNSSYSGPSVAACCGAGPLIYTLAAGSALPVGLSLDSTTGQIAGSPTVAGVFSFTVQATDSANTANFGLKIFTINVSPILVSVNSSAAFGNVGTSYTTSLTASGGIGPYSWVAAAGSQIPPGLTLSSSGSLSGTPTSAGLFNFLYVVTDSATPIAHTYSGSVAIQIYPASGAPPLVFNTNPNLGAYSLGTVIIPLSVSGGTGSYGYNSAPAAGAMPPGIQAVSPVSPGFGPAGVARTAGAYNFSLSVTSGSQTATQAFTMKVTAFTLKDLPTLPPGFAGSPYSYTFTPLNNAGTVTFTITGALPGTLALSSAGVLSGSAPAGNYTVAFTASDGTDTISRSYQLNVSAINITTPAVLSNASQASAYNQTLTATGGTGNYTFTSGVGLPPGLGLSVAGVLGGTPTASPGKYDFLVTATDTAGAAFQKRMSIDVIGATPALPGIKPYGKDGWDDATIGNPYSSGVSVCCGGVAPFSWSVSGLPAGMSLRFGSDLTSSGIGAGDAEIWGVATTAGVYNVLVTVTDSSSTPLTVTNTFPLKVGVLDLVPNLPDGTINTGWGAFINLLGGGPPFPFPVVPVTGGFYDGELPAGVSIGNGPGNRFFASGTPVENGKFAATLLVSDVNGNSLRRTNSLTIGNGTGGITITNSADFGTVAVGTAVSQQLSACCAASISWSVVNGSGSLPPGVALNATTGLLSGTLNTSGFYTFLIKAADTANTAPAGYRQFRINVTPISITTGATLPFGNLGTAYSQTLSATGAAGALSWSVLVGTFLPPGLTLAGSGALTGTPTSTGHYSFTAIAADTGNNVATRVFSVNIYGAGVIAQAITFGALSNVTFGVAPFTLGATASSGLAVTFLSTTPVVCTVSGNTVTIAGAGSCSITANQAGSSTYLPAAPVTQSFTVAKASQNITFGALPGVTLGIAPFALTASASSGLAVTFAAATGSACTVSGATVTIVATGTCTITASQAGSANFAPAPGVSQSFAVASPANSVTLAVGDGIGRPGQTVEIAIQLTATGTAGPSTFQADLNFDATRLTFVSARAGAQATSAGKSLSTNTLPGGDVRILAAGVNQAVISNGVVAYATFTVDSQFTSGSTVVTPKNCSSAAGQANTLSTPCTVGTIRVATCDINLDGTTNVADVQLIINEALAIIPAVHDLNRDGAVNVADVQKVINAALGLGCNLP